MAVNQTLTLELVEQDIVNATSYVRIVWKSKQTNQSYNETSGQKAYYYITCNDAPEETYTVSGYKLYKQKTVTILDKTIPVSHDSSGDCYIKVTTKMDTKISAGVVKLKAELSSPEIPKIELASTISATDANIGSTSALLINRKGSAYTHSIKIDFGTEENGVHGYLSEDGSIVESEEVKIEATNIALHIPEYFYKYIQDNRSGICTLTCTTYYEDDQIGDPYVAEFKVTAQEDRCKPSISGTIIDINENTVQLTEDSTVLVRYFSTARFDATYQVNNYASVSEVKIDGFDMDRTDYSYEVFTRGDATATISNIGSVNGVFSITDGRGYSASDTVSVTMIPYIPVTCFASTKRTDLETGKVSLHIEGSYYNGSFGAHENTLSIGYTFNGVTHELTPVISGNKYTVDATLAEEFDYTQAYNIDVAVSDALTTAPKTVAIKRGIPVFDWGENDFAFHVPVSLDGFKITDLDEPESSADAATMGYVDRCLTSAISTVSDAMLDESSIINLIYPVGSIYIAYNDIDPSTSFPGTTWSRIHNRFLWASYEGEAGETEAEMGVVLNSRNEESDISSYVSPYVKVSVWHRIA